MKLINKILVVIGIILVVVGVVLSFTLKNDKSEENKEWQNEQAQNTNDSQIKKDENENQIQEETEAPEDALLPPLVEEDN